MSSVLKIRDENGNFIDIPAIKGDRGKSAYEQAVEGGYKGTEEEFVKILNEGFSGVDNGHRADKNNPHGVTAEQIGALKTDGSDVMTGALRIHSNNPHIDLDNIGEGYASIYKHADNDEGYDYGTLLRDSNDNADIDSYLEIVLKHAIAKNGDLNYPLTLHHRDNGVSNSYPILHTGNFNNWALSKTIYIENKDILGIVDDGWYYCVGAKNVPTATTYGYVLVRITPDTNNYRMVTWRPANSQVEYTNVLSNGKWLGWTETFTNKGGIFNGHIRVYTAASNFPEIRVGTEYNRSGALVYTDRNHVDIQNFKDGKVTTLSLVHEDDDVELSTILKLWLSNGQHYNIFGEHNKPTGSYTGNGSARTINIGGIGNALLLWRSGYNSGLCIVYGGGLIHFPTSGSHTSYERVLINFTNGVLTVGDTSSANAIYNGTDHIYYYQVL